MGTFKRTGLRLADVARKCKLDGNDAKVAVIAAAALLGMSAHAEVDTEVITTAIAAAVISIGVVGSAILGVKVAVAAFKWVRAAMS